MDSIHWVLYSKKIIYTSVSKPTKARFLDGNKNVIEIDGRVDFDIVLGTLIVGLQNTFNKNITCDQKLSLTESINKPNYYIWLEGIYKTLFIKDYTESSTQLHLLFNSEVKFLAWDADKQLSSPYDHHVTIWKDSQGLEHNPNQGFLGTHSSLSDLAFCTFGIEEQPAPDINAVREMQKNLISKGLLSADDPTVRFINEQIINEQKDRKSNEASIPKSSSPSRWKQATCLSLVLVLVLVGAVGARRYFQPAS